MSTFEGINLFALVLLALYPITSLVLAAVEMSFVWAFAIAPAIFTIALTQTKALAEKKSRWITISARVYYTLAFVFGVFWLPLRPLLLIFSQVVKPFSPAQEGSFYVVFIFDPILFIILPLLSAIVVYSKTGIFALRKKDPETDLEAPVK